MGIPRVSTTLQVITLVSALTVTGTPVAAQVEESFATPAHIDFVDGYASLEREGQVEPADAGMVLIPGDRLRTTTGRVEVIFPDGSVLDVDEYSSVDLQDIALLRLTSGRLLLTVAGAYDPPAAAFYQIDTPVASTTTEAPGEYRVAVLSNPTGLVTELAVTRGAASFSTERGTMPVRSGQRSLAREFESPSYPQAFNSARFDAFDEWAAAQRDARLGTVDSNQYLPHKLQMYGGVLGRAGSWSYHSSYGYVWYPSVGATWRPYYTGYWSAIRPYGWTWIGADPWAWPTHHYGRWGYAGSRWYWIPHHRWGPAWVSWGVSVDYVGWAPLGFNDRPLFNLSVSIGNHWNGWVVVPTSYFNVRRGYVRHHAVEPYGLRSEAFVTQSQAPIAPRYAVPRRGGVAAASAGIARPREEWRRTAEPRAQVGQSVGLGASGQAELDRVQSRRANGRLAGTNGRQPLARTPRVAARGEGAARASVQRTERAAVQRNGRSAVTPSTGAAERPSAIGSLRRAEPTARRQPATRTRQPIARVPQTPTTERRPRAAVSRRPQVSSAGRAVAPGAPTSSGAQSPRGAVGRARPSPSPNAGESASRARAESRRAQRVSPTRVTRQAAGGAREQAQRADQPSEASRPSTRSRRDAAPRPGVRSTGPSGTRPSTPQRANPRVRAPAPQVQAPSGGRTAPARAVPRNRGGSSGARAPQGSRAQSSRGSTPGRAPASRRGR